MANDQLVVPALGRPFTLGMLYDARKEEIVPGVTIWDEEKLQGMIKKCDQNSSDFKISTSDSLEEKSSMLDINASIKASFLGGLIEIGGSAKYLNDRKQSSHQSRVTFQYNATTIFEQLMLTSAGKNQQLSNLVKSSATHLVTGILHGATAFFVFDSKASEVSCVQELEGSMQAVIKKIPSFNVEGNVDIKLSDSEKALSENMTCTFYGDFLLESNPATFEEAVKSYTLLPKLLRDQTNGGVPVKIWMMPLNNLALSAAKVMVDISPDTVGKAQDALEAMYKLKVRCNKLLEDGYNFPSISQKLNSFKKSCDKNIAELQDMLGEYIPKIRAGLKMEEDLLKLMNDKETTPFNIKEMSELMKNIEREVAVIRSCEEMMKEAKILASEVEVEAEMLDPEVEEILCFAFTSLENSETENSETKNSETKSAWYRNKDLIRKVREKTRILGSLSRALKSSSKYRCVVTEINDADHEGATLYLYSKDGDKTNFDNLKVPDVLNVKLRKELIWYATGLTLDQDTAHPDITIEDKTATYKKEQQAKPDLPQRFNSAVQVLCKEKLDGLHYWEVEWSLDQNADVGAAICYPSMNRKGSNNDINKIIPFGENEKSWTYKYEGKGDAKDGATEAIFIILYNAKSEQENVPPTGCPRVGFFLDWKNGSFSSYIVTGEQLHHIHSFSVSENSFSEPVFPGFIVSNENNFVRLCF